VTKVDLHLQRVNEVLFAPETEIVGLPRILKRRVFQKYVFFPMRG
jgi:hypothetical protein